MYPSCRIYLSTRSIAARSFAGHFFGVLCLIVFAAGSSFAGGPETKASSSASSSAATSGAASTVEASTGVANPQGTVSINVAVDALSNRHAISPDVYGGAYPQNAATITDSGLTVVR
jgi:hypothetical protein